MHAQQTSLKLSPQDSEVSWFLDQLADNADIGLFACESSEIVDFVKDNAGRRKVWGTTHLYSADNLYFYQTHTEWDHVVFGAQVTLNYQDVTYSK